MKERTPPSRKARRGRKGRPHFAQEPLSGTDVRFRVPPSLSMPKRLFVICHYCGHSPDGSLPADGACPKCGGHSWERYALPEPLVPRHMK
jgi:hypothetical protein